VHALYALHEVFGHEKSGVHALYALHGLHQVYAVVCPHGTCRVLPHRCRSGPPRRRAPSGIIPTHVCDKGSRCGCCVLRSIWSASPAEPSSSSTSSRTIGCLISHSSELSRAEFTRAFRMSLETYANLLFFPFETRRHSRYAYSLALEWRRGRP
jgi:hypothetical protein